MQQQIKVHQFNPKCMTKVELFGKLTSDSNQWMDGVLTKYSLQVTAEKGEKRHNFTLIPEWVEKYVTFKIFRLSA